MPSPYASAEYKANRRLVLESSNYICHYCGAHANTADHLQPVSKGGSHDLSNLVAACKTCNSTRQDKTMVRLKYWNNRYK